MFMSFALVGLDVFFEKNIDFQEDPKCNKFPIESWHH